MPAEDDLYPEHVRQAAFEWHVLISSGAATREELAAFERWRSADEKHNDAYDRATTVWSALGTLGRDELDEAFFRQSWRHRIRALASNLSLNRLQTRNGILGALGVLAMAFVGVAAIGQFVGKTHNPTMSAEDPSRATVARHVSALGEVKTIELPDGTSVTLGAATELLIVISSSERKIELKRGVALFDVVSDPERPLRVEAGYFTATVLGTVFDVRNNGGVVRLSVGEGLVEVSHPSMTNDEPTSTMHRRQLSAGQQIAASPDEGLTAIGTYRESSFATWRQDRLTYVGGTLRELVADANRYSGRPIEIEGNADALQDLKVTVSFSGRDIDGMLATLPDMFPVEVDASRTDVIVIRAR